MGVCTKMNSDKIKGLIESVRKAVEHIDDQKLKERTYEIVLNNLLSSSKIGLHATQEPERPEKIEEPNDKPLLNPIAILASKFKVDHEKVEDYFEFKNNSIHILHPLQTYFSNERHLLFTLVLLTIQKIVYDIREIDSSVLREAAKHKGISTLVNLSTNLKKFPQYIIHKHGQKGSNSGSYQLTVDGYNYGVSIIQKFFSGEDIVELAEDAKSHKKGRNSGLGKEVDKLYEEGFFDDFKKVTEAQKELKRRGFFNRRQDVDAYIRQNLMKTKNLLLREKKDGTWHYVKRK